jgi:hypothetical protein
MGEISYSEELAFPSKKYQNPGAYTHDAERIHDGPCDAAATSSKLPVRADEQMLRMSSLRGIWVGIELVCALLFDRDLESWLSKGHDAIHLAVPADD